MASNTENELDSKNNQSALGNVVFPEELEMFVLNLREFAVDEIGSKAWLDCHEMIIKLSQQAIIEASAFQEEAVKESLVLHQKLKVLVHEAFCVFVWKTQVLPNLLEIDPNPETTFFLYTVLFHEGATIALLETALYHQNGCESLDEINLDLVDYCAIAVSQLIGLVSMGHYENLSNIDVDETTMSELERQKRDLIYKIGLRCLSILNYIADKIDVLHISVGRRMITVHDIPCLLSDILHFKPWIRKTSKGFEKFIDEKWVLVRGDDIGKVVKYEAQSWFCFRQLLFNQKISQVYEITEFRQRQLAKCQALLNEVILDQLPPLAELKHYLCTLQISQNFNSNKKHNLLLEDLPKIKESIIKNAENYGGFYKIAIDQAEKFFTTKHEEIVELAKRLNQAYNTDLLAEMEAQISESADPEKNSDGKELCIICKKVSEKKCSQCLTAFYCSRYCQETDWPNHKKICSSYKQPVAPQNN